MATTISPWSTIDPSTSNCLFAQLTGAKSKALTNNLAPIFVRIYQKCLYYFWVHTKMLKASYTTIFWIQMVKTFRPYRLHQRSRRKVNKIIKSCCLRWKLQTGKFWVNRKVRNQNRWSSFCLDEILHERLLHCTMPYPIDWDARRAIKAATDGW